MSPCMWATFYVCLAQHTWFAPQGSSNSMRNLDCKTPTRNQVSHSPPLLSFITQVPVGELEATFTTTACRVANLEWIMQDQRTRDSVQPLVEEFLRVSGEDHRGTRLADEAHFPPSKPPKTVTLNHRTHALLQQLSNNTLQSSNTFPHTSNALELEKTLISGVIYASEKSLPRDSNVIF